MFYKLISFITKNPPFRFGEFLCVLIINDSYLVKVDIPYALDNLSYMQYSTSKIFTYRNFV